MPSSMASSGSRDWTCVSYISCFGRWVPLPLAPAGKPTQWMHLLKSNPCQDIRYHLWKKEDSVLQLCLYFAADFLYCWSHTIILFYSLQFSSVQSLSRVGLFATPWIGAHQASLSITNSRSSLKLTSIESVMPSSHLILCHSLLLLPPIPPSIRVFSNESTLCIRWPKYWILTSASVLPKNTQDWSPLEWTGWISLQSKGLSRVFSNTTVQKHQFFGT